MKWIKKLTEIQFQPKSSRDFFTKLGVGLNDFLDTRENRQI